MIVHNDCNRKGKVLILLAGFLKRDDLVMFSKISPVFLLQLLVTSFSIIIIIIAIIINVATGIYLNSYLLTIGYLIIYDFITIYLFIFPFFYSFLILTSFLLHFPTFISSFDLFLFFHFLIPISPAAFYYFKSYPYWPSKPPRRRPKPSEVLGELKSLFSLLLCQLQFYGFS